MSTLIAPADTSSATGSKYRANKIACLALALVALEMVMAYSAKYGIPLIANIDFTIAQSLGRASFKYPSLTYTALYLQGADLFKTVPLIAACIWCWYSTKSTDQKWLDRQRLLIGLTAACVSVALVMAIQKFIGHRPRPIYVSDFSFMSTAVGFRAEHDVSSFPSDTSALAFALSTVIFFQNRQVGIAAYVWAVVFVLFPRMFVGLHYLSDVTAAALNGVACVIVAQIISERVSLPIGEFVLKHKPWVYATSFVLFFEMAEMGGEIRPILDSAFKFILHRAY